MFTNNHLVRQMQEHTDLQNMLKNANERLTQAETCKEYWDSLEEIEILCKELRDTEDMIGMEGTCIWS